MREVNEATSAHAAQRATAEAIERGGTGLSVTELLAKVTRPREGARTADSTGQQAGRTAGPPPGKVPEAGVEPAPGMVPEPSTGFAPGSAPDPGVGSVPGMTTAPGTQPVARNGPTLGVEPVPGTDPALGKVPAAEPPSASAADGTPASAPSPDTDALAALIASAAARHLPGGHLSPDADFFDAGGSSVNAVELVAELEDQLGLEIDLDEVFADARPRSLAQRWLKASPAAGLRIPTTATAPGAHRTTPAPPTAVTAIPPASPTTVAATTPAPPATLPSPDTAPTPVSAAVPAPPATAHAPHTTAHAPHTTAHAPHTTARREDLDQILADLALADRLPFTGSPEPLPPRRILLTGATGFLGGHMLLDLLRHSDAHLYCLVRAADEDAAVARLGEALRSYHLPWSSEVRRRITVLPGDIRRSHLGLSDEVWNTLAHELDSVVGVAAAVDFLRGYQSLRQSNVLGTLTLAELAATGRPKPLHHISSIAVFNEVGITAMGEDDPLAHVDRLIAGYDQTKWAAEVALRRARDHGLVVTALRPGGIGGHTKTGAYNPQDLSSGLFSAFARFRTVPAFRHLNAAPVDWVSRAAVAAVCEPDAWGYDYNLTGVPNTLDDVVRDMALGGMHVRVQDWDEWRTDTLARLQSDPVPELSFLSRVLQSPAALKLCEATLTGPAATMDRTAALLEALGLEPAARYDARAQLKTFERLAGDGLARLPHKDDQPYLWFKETAEGAVRPIGTSAPATPCSTELTLSIASMHQLVTERRVDVRGELRCTALHPEPLVVERGDVWIRPEEGIPHQHGLRHQLLCYRLQLRDPDGGRWWLEGRKYARARRDVWRQTRALSVEIGREGEAAHLAGEIVVPADSYVRDQIDGIKVDPRLTGQEKRAAKLTWLAWFGLEMGRGLLGPFARAAADLLDLRRTQTPTEHNR
ncbi:thioester reductase domain-containing protein [Streptomyces sp. NPDC006602]|uniref:thioester reductase domain-containing protein n=1 Tax=Streptomyces sp. NPDC006602 TaxID=3364751 RepID=UPI0036770A7D